MQQNESSEARGRVSLVRPSFAAQTHPEATIVKVLCTYSYLGWDRSRRTWLPDSVMLLVNTALEIPEVFEREMARRRPQTAVRLDAYRPEHGQRYF